MSWNEVRIPVLLIGIVVVTVASFIGYVYSPGTGYKGKLGLDLRSGSRIVCQLNPPDNAPSGFKIDEVVLNRTKQVFEKRLNPTGTKEIIITSQGTQRIEIELPEETNLTRAEQLVSKVGHLDFREEKIDPPPGWRSGRRLWAASTSRAPTTTSSTASRKWSSRSPPRARQKFGELTERLVGKPLGIFFDGVKIDAPRVNEPITTAPAVSPAARRGWKTARRWPTISTPAHCPSKSRFSPPPWSAPRWGRKHWTAACRPACSGWSWS